MNRQALCLPGYLSKFYPALIGSLVVVLLMVFSPTQAKSPASPVQVANGFSPIELTRTDTRYGLASLNNSSGFIPAPEGVALDNAPDLVPQETTFGLDPDFRLHHRYWLYTRIENNTENSDWVFHISNFGFLRPRVLIRDGSGQTIKTFSNSGYESGTDINTIGRAVKVRLPAGKSYLMVVELKAHHAAWHPYIALMSDRHYQTWKTQQDFAYKLAVGVILGLILLGLTCWLLTRERAFFWASLSASLQLAYYLEHSSIPAILWQSTYEKTALFWLLIYSTMLSQLAFAGSFLKLNRNSGKWYYAFLGAALTTLFLCIASLVLPFQVNMGLAALSYLVVALVILGSGVAKVRTEGSYYIIYLLGWFPMVLSILQVAWVTQGPRETLGEVTVSYKMIHVLYIQILHMFLHTIALILLIRALREEKLRAEYISQAKSRFIAQSSHDLSQPLNSMSIFLEYLKPHIHGLDGTKIFDRLKNTHRQMSESFKSIMDLSKLESGTIRPEPKPVNLADLFSRLQHEYRMLATEKNIGLSFQPCSLKVFSDPVLLERILRNLISNAIKYTDSGKVIVGCRRRGENVVIQVLDTGCGIDKESQNHIFDIYYRSARDPKQTDGSGIGLSIVKHISELLNHPVNMTSAPGKGSSFTISVPRLGEVSPSQHETVKPAEDMPVVALVFQDNELRDSLIERLERWHCSVLTFSSVEAARQSSTFASVLLCEYPSLGSASLSSEAAGMLAQQTVAACVCDPDTPLPDNWIALSTAVLPSQLRALLNVALRRRRSQLSLTPA
ncbi:MULTISPECIES: sensor histidine kinase [unclassified Microbulbifer]|uniref:sensor histidine kinase n=1 Tax=unclassified Microbulbifer TaxID=2619833 RepID=UPI0027E5392E|nr:MULTISPECIES: sensor histidine kinase [unclassified Microbulbifer]